MIQKSQRVFEDTELLERLQRNDEYAFTMLYEKYWPILIRMATSLVEDGDTAKEIVQELFVGLYKKRLQLRVKVSLSAYLYVSLRNKVRNYIRHCNMYNRHLRVVKRTLRETTNDVEHFVDHNELQRQILVCLDEMPSKCREVYLMYNHGKCPMKQIAIQLRRPLDTVEKQFRRSLLFLRAHLAFLYQNGGQLTSKVSISGKLSYEQARSRLPDIDTDADRRFLQTNLTGNIGS